MATTFTAVGKASRARDRSLSASRKGRKSGAGGAGLLLSLVLLASASEARPVEVTYELALRSPHVWRGITLRDFPVLNASATARHENGLALQLWVGLDASDDDGRGGEVQEIDVDLSHTWETASTSFTLGYVALVFPGGIDPTGELYARARFKGLLAPAVEVFYNVDLLRDVFAQVSFGHTWRLGRDWVPSVRATMAYAGGEYAAFFGGSQAGLHHWGLQVDFDRARRKTPTPRPYGIKFRLGYSESLNENVLPDQPARLWSGLYLSLSHP